MRAGAPWGLWLPGAGLCAALLAVGCERVDRGTRFAARRAVAAPGLRAPVAPQGGRTPAEAPVRRVELGRSVRGVPLVLEVFGDGPERILVFGGIHGDEASSAEVARRLADWLRIEWRLFEGRTVGVLAEANPDGLALGRRTNANGVDLNRNFPARNWRAGSGGRVRHGVRAASEPETRAIMGAVELIRPDRVMSIHTARVGGCCNNYDGPAAQLAQRMAAHNRYPVRASMGYPTPGSFGSWAGTDRRIPTITLELPGGKSGWAAWRENQAALVAFIQAGTPAREAGAPLGAGQK